MHILVLLVLPLLVLIAASPVLILLLHITSHKERLRIRRDHQRQTFPDLLHAGIVSASPASHSPRAVNHVKALVRSGRYSACLHAYPPCRASEDPLMSFVPIGTTDESKRPSLIRSVLHLSKLMYASLVSSHSAALRTYDIIIVNTPPCIPAFAVVLFAARFVHSCPVVVDWHNLACSIMETTGKSRSVVMVARFVEWSLGRHMDGHLCVSSAMANFLAEHWAIDAHVLYDRPPDTFGRVRDLEVQHKMFEALHMCSDVPLLPNSASIMTEYAQGAGNDGLSMVQLRPCRPAMFVSSTSWTPDEDFSILLDALVKLDARIQTAESAASGRGSLPFGGRAICVITGKGPLRDAFQAKCAGKGLRNVQVWFAWLPLEDYPRLLGSADLGLSMHTSSSGLDLPMKVVDMLGCGLPVIAYKYQCIEELILPGRTGLLFQDVDELANELFDLLFTLKGDAALREMSQHISVVFSTPNMRWQKTWEQDALPVLQHLHGDRWKAS